MGKFSGDDTIKLVDLFVEQECRWNLRNIHCRNKDMRMAAEKEIINNLGKTGFGISKLKQKIKNLRCTYNQECLKVKKSTKSGAGADDIYIPNIKLFDAFDNIMKLAKVGKKTEGYVETKISAYSIDGEEDEGGTADEPATATPEIQSSNVLSITPGSDKSPAAGRRRKLENLTQAVQQLWELSQNIQDSSKNEHGAFGNFVAATLNNLGKVDALMAQHEIQGVLFKYRLANVDDSKHSSFQEPNSNKNTQTTLSYSSYNSLQSPYSNHSTDGYPHQQYSENTNSTFYSDKHTNAP
ncbi:hypothetical protein FQA39_LY10815 [Lamprigera yunnana]|nr:hypothetical protein FQA39_LY10815 [Lamprigera yunnana]